MKNLILFFLLYSSFIFSQENFEKYFTSKQLRVDYFHSGNNETEFYSIDELKSEPFWGGSKNKLIDTFQYGKYLIAVLDSASNEVIYSRGFSTLFSEWQTTEEAKQTTKSFSETFVMPFPKNTVKLEFQSRNTKGIFENKFEFFINPKNYFITPERKKVYSYFDVANSGDSDSKVDIVIIPDGYTKEEMSKFKEDCKRFVGYLFNSSPFKENKNKFNIKGIEAPSEESGTDIPAENIWKKTSVNTTFYTFDLERYLMTSDNKSLRDIAANAPYDQIYILVNTDKYGGGAIYNHYSVCVNKSPYEEYIFVHEFGHGFAGLGDEYFDSEVSYQNFYPAGVEPWEPNLTTLTNFDEKWKNMIPENVPIPTPPDEKIKNEIGVFEGGGYVTKGVYRPKFDCTMRSIAVDNFCEVCKKAIQDMINFYGE